jgi:hypothetical protein
MKHYFLSKIEKTDTHLNMNESHNHNHTRKETALKGKPNELGL